MQQVIIAIHLMVVTALVVLVLYQKSEGSALGMSQSGMFSGRGQGNALTKATGVLATIFFLTSIALTVLPAWERRITGDEDWTKAIDSKMELKEIKPKEGAPADAPAAAPGTAGDADLSIFDQLQRAQQRRQSAPAGESPSAAPVAPAAPAPTAAAPAPQAEKPALRPTTEEPGAKPSDVKPPEAKAPEAKAPEPAPAAPAAPAPAPAQPKAEAPKTEAPKANAPVTWTSPTH